MVVRGLSVLSYGIVDQAKEEGDKQSDDGGRYAEVETSETYRHTDTSGHPHQRGGGKA